ncbi:MAG: hypothetical protein COC20_07040 [Cellvibrionales bacterium]|nr:MAG: hypothetical protein COC20_07040 [Cellvibrionales bacterium]
MPRVIRIFAQSIWVHGFRAHDSWSCKVGAHFKKLGIFQPDTITRLALGFCLFIAVQVATLGSAHGAQAVSVDGIRLWRAPDHTRLVFDLSGPVDHKVFVLENPHRLVIDVNGVSSSVKSTGLDFSKTPISGLRTAARNERDLRIVLDLSSVVKPRSFLLGSNEQYGDRLVVDLYEGEQSTTRTVADVVSGSGQLRDVIIAIDAGHGGDDPGAIGPGRIYEKKVKV